ncbi:MAG: PDR/VanB family oxidoreductase [Pseudomonadota bacterium]|nr:PDR/VanB family oxidoreductase [Pseudomonadota bacterium]
MSARRALAQSIEEFTLVAHDGDRLPSFEPGAHITMRTPSGAMRRYSLVNDGRRPNEYVIAVKIEPYSRGGSRSMHGEAQPGTALLAEPPKNDFPLAEADDYLLIAGGIGITPIHAMASRLAADKKEFQLIYCTRSEDDAAYLPELRGFAGEKLTVHYDAGDPDRLYDFWDHFAVPRDMKVYCCGPKPLMEEIKAISGHWPEGRVNFEDFKPVETTRPDDQPFKVELARSGATIEVPADRSILEALRDNGFSTVSSCESGTCGTCKTRLINGEADHRDMVLMDEERNSKIMICVSRAKSGRLVIDL